MTSEPVRVGVAGLGRGFALMRAGFDADPRLRLVAAAEPRAEGRAAFEAAYGGRTYSEVEALCADPEVEAVYVATPHQLHAEHALAAIAAGRHVLVEKPIAISLGDAERMVAAAAKARLLLIVGPCHSFDGPVRLARSLIAEGSVGRPRMIQALNCTDYLYRARHPEELRTEAGGGVVFGQAIHQIDVVRLLAGGRARRVFARTGAWDPRRPTEGAYAAILEFEDGAFATLSYSGYGLFDSDAWMDDVDELGRDKAPEASGGARRTVADASPEVEAALRARRAFGVASAPDAGPHHEHFGPVIVHCDRADLRLTPDGVTIHGDGSRGFRAAPREASTRAAVADALVAAVRRGVAPVQTGGWGLASLEVCLGILRSAAHGAPVELRRQVAVPGEESAA